MKLGLLPWLPLTLCATQDALAQTQARLDTATAVTAWAQNVGGRIQDTIPARTSIPTRRVVYATTNAGAAAEGTVTLDPSAAPLELRLEAFSTEAAGGGGNTAAATDGTVEWTLYGGGHGTLTITVGMLAARGNSASLARVTGPGIDEQFQGFGGSQNQPPISRTTTHPISFPGSFVLRCQLTSSASGLGIGYYYAGAQIVLRFVPTSLPGVLQQSYGSPCGASLAVTDTTTTTQHVLDIVTTGGAANGLFLLWFGVTRAAIPIPGSPCLLLTDPAVAVVLTADGSGVARLRLPLSGPLRTIPIDLQSIAIDATLRASDGVELTFVDY